MANFVMSLEESDTFDMNGHATHTHTHEAWFPMSHMLNFDTWEELHKAVRTAVGALAGLADAREGS